MPWMDAMPHGWMLCPIDGCYAMDGWMRCHGWIDGWIDGWMDAMNTMDAMDAMDAMPWMDAMDRWMDAMDTMP